MAESKLQVTLCWSLAPRQVQEVALLVPEGSSVQAVLDMAIAQQEQEQAQAHPAQPARTATALSALSALQFQQPGIWGRQVTWVHTVQAGDRIEWYRPLKVDPKVARRQRFKRQGKGRTGLFAHRKSGSAAGY